MFFRKPSDHVPHVTIFHTILRSMLWILFIEIALLVGILYLCRINTSLEQNAVDILQIQTENRQNYLQGQMLDAQDLSSLAGKINAVTQAMLDDGEISLDTLDSGSDAASPLLLSIGDSLISSMRHRPVTGIFVVLNTHDLDTRKKGEPLPCLYLRDLDPNSSPSQRNSDLMLVRAPAQVVQSLYIATDTSWMPSINYGSNGSSGFLYPVFQAAYHGNGELDAADYGHWTSSPYTLSGDDHSAIAYTIPLILDDGTVYGVLGVEILESYLQALLPGTELQNDSSGTYLLGVASNSAIGKDDLTVSVISASPAANAPQQSYDQTLLLKPSKRGGYQSDSPLGLCHAAVAPLTLYNRNAPFSNERWLLIGTVNSKVLFAFADNVRSVIAIAIAFTLVLGALGSLVVARNLAHPVELLYHEVVDGQEKKQFPQLSHTNIRELDRLADALTSLNSELLNNSTKFLRIMDMASVELGGYELRFDTGSVYVTDNFFALLGAPQPKDCFLSVRRFEEKLSHIQLSHPCTTTAEGDKMLTIRKEGETRYIMLRVTNDQTTQVGLAEDVTAATLERMRIEHERDYDILTGLYNRQAFHRVSEELFRDPHQLGVAALLMMDLDNLKHINDTYGHDWGDQYIHRTGRCLAENTPNGTVVSRLSGDEFVLLFYGYSSQDQIREKIRTLSSAMQKSVAILPSGNELRISISGGVAWYPASGTDMDTLKKYADFALYQVKRTNKGHLEEFSMEIYQQEAQAAQLRRDFQQLLTEERVYYVFQPIFSARTGKVMAYEALMRSDREALRSPATIMKLAREQGALCEIERLTFFKSLETFDHLRSEGLVRRDTMLFINSIASVCLPREDSEYMESRWHELCRQMVIEITEEEEIDHEALETKRHAPGFSGMFALDDYGSGFANENSLLELSPRFIKVDIAIIRGIDTDLDKQQIVQNIVAYAHPRSMQIIAEGVETAAELRKVIELGADALQGYFLAKPAAVPAQMAPAARKIIAEYSSVSDSG